MTVLAVQDDSKLFLTLLKKKKLIKKTVVFLSNITPLGRNDIFFLHYMLIEMVDYQFQTIVKH